MQSFMRSLLAILAAICSYNLACSKQAASNLTGIYPMRKIKTAKTSVTASAASAQAGIAAAIDVAASPSPAIPTAADTYRGMQRDSNTVNAMRANYAVYSDRDTAYLSFIGACAREHNGQCTLIQLHNSGILRAGSPDSKRYNPRYAGSSKATDAGAIERLIKAGYFTYSLDRLSLVATERAEQSSVYNGTK
jgi:hypothetical protein